VPTNLSQDSEPDEPNLINLEHIHRPSLETGRCTPRTPIALPANQVDSLPTGELYQRQVEYTRRNPSSDEFRKIQLRHGQGLKSDDIVKALHRDDRAPSIPPVTVSDEESLENWFSARPSMEDMQSHIDELINRRSMRPLAKHTCGHIEPVAVVAVPAGQRHTPLLEQREGTHILVGPELESVLEASKKTDFSVPVPCCHCAHLSLSDDEPFSRWLRNATPNEDVSSLAIDDKNSSPRPQITQVLSYSIPTGSGSHSSSQKATSKASSPPEHERAAVSPILENLTEEESKSAATETSKSGRPSSRLSPHHHNADADSYSSDLNDRSHARHEWCHLDTPHSLPRILNHDTSTEAKQYRGLRVTNFTPEEFMERYPADPHATERYLPSPTPAKRTFGARGTEFSSTDHRTPVISQSHHSQSYKLNSPQIETSFASPRPASSSQRRSFSRASSSSEYRQNPFCRPEKQLSSRSLPQRRPQRPLHRTGSSLS